MIEAAPRPKTKFYTTGYAGQDINDLKPMLGALDAVLVDVRFSPTSGFWLVLGFTEYDNCL